MHRKRQPVKSHRIFLLRLVLLIPLILASVRGSVVSALPLQQTSSAEDHAQALLDTLTPEEKVGQLFLVTFIGTDVDFETQIYDLITNYHIGGVLLQDKSDNFLYRHHKLRTAPGSWRGPSRRLNGQLPSQTRSNPRRMKNLDQLSFP